MKTTKCYIREGHSSASHVEPAYRDGWNDCYAKITAETIAWANVGEFLDRLKPWSLHSFARGWILRHDPSGRTIEAPTITELAAKLEKIK